MFGWLVFILLLLLSAWSVRGRGKPRFGRLHEEMDALRREIENHPRS